jgi:hypothetical protein
MSSSNLERRLASIVLLLSTLVATGLCDDAIFDVAGHVSVDQYRVYELDIENMGLGFYGGSAYNQGYRNRDGWRGGGTLGSREACVYLADQFLSLGLTTTIQGDYRNVVGELPGVGTPGNIYIVCCHYDTAGDGEHPGGDDNASGTAGVLEAARVLSPYRFDATLRFIAFNAEEDWMLGSQDYVDKAVVPNGENVVGVINLDMILRPGWDSDPGRPIDLELETGPSALQSAWVDTFKKAAAKYVPSLVIDPAVPYTDYWDAGDQGPFIAVGYPCLVAIDNTAEEIWDGAINLYYHSPLDASDKAANSRASPSGVTYDYGFAANVVRVSVATLAGQAGIVETRVAGFSKVQTLSAGSETQNLVPFRLAGEDYLLAANSRKDLTYNANSTLYKWNGESFVEHQSIPTRGASDAEFFTLGADAFLAIANRCNGTVYSVDSKIYKWDGARFVEFQSLPGWTAGDLEFFAFGDSAYLVVGDRSDDATPTTGSKIYKWDGARFAEFQTIATAGSAGWEFFLLDGQAYLAAANTSNGLTYNLDSMIYRWNGSSFAAFETIATSGASDWTFFTLAGESYLAVANSYDGVTADINSRIYKWDGTRFVSYQSIPTHGARDWEFFTSAGESYLAVANKGANAVVYRWNGMRFVEFASIPTGGACKWTSLTLGAHHYLAAAGASGGAASVLYQYRGPYTGNLDDDGDVDFRDYAVFAAAWRSRPGQPFWNESCDISVPADNVVDLRDLAVLADHWLKRPAMAKPAAPPSTGSQGSYPKR